MTLTATAGSSSADAFVTLAAFKTYCDAKGYDYSAYDDDTQIEPAIRRGTTHLSVKFTWKGYRTNGRSQSLAWPRTAVYDAEGEEVDSTTIPQEVVDATCEAAWYELSTGSLNPAVVLTDRVKSEQVGALRTEYVDVPAAASSAAPILPLLKSIVSGLTLAGSGGLSARAVRG